MVDVHTQTHQCSSTLMTHKPTRTQILRLFVMCTDTAQWIHRRLRKREPLKFHAHFLSSFFYLLFHLLISFHRLAFLSLCPFWRCFLPLHRYCHPQPKPEATIRSTLTTIPTHALHMTQSHHRKSPEPEQAGKLWKTRIQFGTYGA